MYPTLTRRVLAFLELNPGALEQLGLPETVYRFNSLWPGPPLPGDKLPEVCRVVWQTHQARLSVADEAPRKGPVDRHG
jgi:hypothetical protein